MPGWNIVENVDGRWCAAETGDNRLAHIPHVKLTQFQQNQSAIKQSQIYWADLPRKEAEGGSPYDKLYLASWTGNIYYLPYLGEGHHDISQTWNAGAGPGPGNNDAIKYKLIAANFEAPAAGIEQPHVWSGQALHGRFEITFPLINTFDPENDIVKNYMFLYSLLAYSLLDRPTALHYLPPCIYTMEIPGIRYSPACTFDKVTVKNKGAMHYHTLLGKKRAIPDAYEVTIGVKELLLESRTILNVGMGETPASVVTAGLVAPAGATIAGR